MIEICLPKLGESIVSATVVEWIKKEGEWVEEDEPLLEVATDKVNSEIPSPARGRLQILAQQDEEVEIGGVLGRLMVEESSESIVSINDLDSKSSLSSTSPYKSPKERPKKEETSEHLGFLSPAVLRLAREKGIPLQELESIHGTGEKERITKRDIESYLVARGNQTISSGEVERQVMSPMRKAIADNMTRSFYQAPHAYIMTQVDVTSLMEAISKRKQQFLEEYGVKLTITSVMAQMIAQVVQVFPLINASIDQEAILIKKHVNLGLAVAVDHGLVVPVLKGCKELTVLEISQQIADLSLRARSGNLQPDEVTEGSITLTNFGMSGALMGLPIIRYPEVAIIGMGSIEKGVSVDQDDQIAIRKKVYLTLSFDHRAIDGMYAAGALHLLKEKLENYAVSL